MKLGWCSILLTNTMNTQKMFLLKSLENHGLQRLERASSTKCTVLISSLYLTCNWLSLMTKKSKGTKMTLFLLLRKNWTVSVQLLKSKTEKCFLLKPVKAKSLTDLAS